MRIAYFSPLNPVKVGISDYSEELLPHLSRYAKIDLFIDNYQPANKEIRENFNLFHYLTLENRLKDYDIILYHIGNNPAHTYIYNSLMKYPGVVVLHDFVLHHLALKAMVDSGNWEEYMEEMKDSYGDTGALASIQVLKGYGRDTLYFLYPFNERLLSQAAGVIVHSDYLKKTIQKKFPRLPVARVNHGIKLRPQEDFNWIEAKQKLGIREDTFVISSFGFLTGAKSPEAMLRAFKLFHRRHKNSLLLLVGKVDEELDLTGLIEKHSLKSSIRTTGYVDLKTFYKYICLSDVCLNLRYPSGGETSGAILRIMACGKPIVVSNYGQFAELPDNCCIKVDLGKNQLAELVAYLNLLWQDEELKLKIGQNAQNYIQQNYTWEISARQYARCLPRFKPAMKKKGEIGRQTLLDRRREFGHHLITELISRMENLGISGKAQDYLTSILLELEIMPA